MANEFAKECDSIRAEIGKVNDGVHALGLGLARVETRLAAHEERHNRDDATAATRRRSDSDGPRRRSSMDLGAVAKIAAGIGVALAVGLSAWSSGTAPDEDDVQKAARAAASVVAEIARGEMRQMVNAAQNAAQAPQVYDAASCSTVAEP